MQIENHLEMKASSVKRPRVLVQLPVDQTYIAHESAYVEKWNKAAQAKNDLYSRMVAKNANCPRFDFMDGPPFVSGNLHPGHIAVSAVKSVMFNHKIMTGHLCQVKLGYDCHGLPAVNKAASENGLNTIESIKAVGLRRFNEMCNDMITKYSSSWTPLFQRVGRLADFDDVYMTRDRDFMETCFWIFQQLWNKGLVYKGNKVMAYSYANQTPLSQSEASSNYKEKETKSIYVGFEVVSPKFDNASKEYLVAWTTTPWTLPANRALCVNNDLVYVRVRGDDDPNIYILGKNCVTNFFNKKVKITVLSEIKGSELVGMQYKSIFNYMDAIDADNGVEHVYRVLSDSYVTESKKDVGTGIVHLAPAFGEDDFRVCSNNSIVSNITVSNYCPIDSAGQFTSVVKDFEGRLVFDCEDDLRATLKKMGIPLKIQLYKHEYPYCWRSETPLIYQVVPSWYIAVTKLKDRMIELNKTVKWYPSEIGENRFHQWLNGVKDWAISRSTSYATPIPIWQNDDGTKHLSVGSIEELERLTCTKVENLHPEFVNDLIIIKDGETYHRIADTFDCWFESGAVPMGQIHYPFNKEKAVELDSKEYLSDFICEGMDQTRGWFYTLMVLSTAIFDKAPYRHVMCTGMILDKDGNKFSKKLGNFVDPMDAISEFGSDVIRTYFINSPVISADCLKYNEDLIKRLKVRFTPYINGVKFWIEHTMNYMKQNSIDQINIPAVDYNALTNLMDRWIILRTDLLIKTVSGYMDKFQFSNAVDSLLDFIDELTNWYIKFNRDRIKGLESPEDWTVSIQVLYNVLMKYCQLWAPITPFMSEHIYHHLRVCSDRFADVESVLLTDYPSPSAAIDTADTIKLFRDLRRICQMVRSMRDGTPKHTKVVIPLISCTIYHDNPEYLDVLKENVNLIQSELNCLTFNFEKLNDNVTIMVEPDRKAIGQTFRKDAQVVLKLIEDQTESFMMKVYDGSETFRYTVNGYNEVLDQRFYKLSRVPKHTINQTDVRCAIDNDLMVSVDLTYNEKIHIMYQNKRLYSAVQSMRKNLGLRPWNRVSVILDSVYVDHIDKLYGHGFIVNTLSASLTNSDVSVFDFSGDAKDVDGTEYGISETETSKMCCDHFEWEPFSEAEAPPQALSGRIAVVFDKS